MRLAPEHVARHTQAPLQLSLRLNRIASLHGELEHGNLLSAHGPFRCKCMRGKCPLSHYLAASSGYWSNTAVRFVGLLRSSSDKLYAMLDGDGPSGHGWSALNSSFLKEDLVRCTSFVDSSHVRANLMFEHPNKRFLVWIMWLGFALYHGLPAKLEHDHVYNPFAWTEEADHPLTVDVMMRDWKDILLAIFLDRLNRTLLHLQKSKTMFQLLAKIGRAEASLTTFQAFQAAMPTMEDFGERGISGGGGICKSPHAPKPVEICKSPHAPKPGEICKSPHAPKPTVGLVEVAAPPSRKRISEDEVPLPVAKRQEHPPSTKRAAPPSDIGVDISTHIASLLSVSSSSKHAKFNPHHEKDLQRPRPEPEAFEDLWKGVLIEETDSDDLQEDSDDVLITTPIAPARSSQAAAPPPVPRKMYIPPSSARFATLETRRALYNTKPRL